MARNNTLHIKTPEGITFALFLAGPVVRFLAWIIDFFCVLVIMIAVNMGTQATGIMSIDFAQAMAIILYFVVSIGYGIFCEWRYKGQTLGKKLLDLRVMDGEGLRLHASQIIVRNLLRFIDSLPVCYLVGGIASLVSSKGQRLGDLAANTIVIREAKISRPDLEQLLAHKYNSLKGHPPLVARLRQRTSPHEADIALQALLRRDDLDPIARVDLFAEIAGHFKKIVGFPEEVTEGISDEQLIRNIVEVLFVSK
jgi:uncharacterized RDD family membrane protein YckC